jgi:hypothetical protein
MKHFGVIFDKEDYTENAQAEAFRTGLHVYCLYRVSG